MVDWEIGIIEEKKKMLENMFDSHKMMIEGITSPKEESKVRGRK